MNQSLKLFTVFNKNEDKRSIVYWQIFSNPIEEALIGKILFYCTLHVDCTIFSLDQYANQGCSIQAQPGTFGAEFNSGGGGVFALEWIRDSSIRAWFFKRSSIPADIAQVDITMYFGLKIPFNILIKIEFGTKLKMKLL